MQCYDEFELFCSNERIEAPMALFGNLGQMLGTQIAKLQRFYDDFFPLK